MIRKLHRRILTFFFGIAYRSPLLFKLLHDIAFGKKMHRWRNLVAEILPEGRTLEIGCGMFPAIQYGTILDNSKPLLEKVPRRDSQMKVLGSALTLPFSDNSFDVIVAVFPPGVTSDHGFFHEKKFWDEIRRVLVLGGTFITAASVQYKHWFWDKVFGRMFDPPPEKDFWEHTKKVAVDMTLIRQNIIDCLGNMVIIIDAKNPN